MDQKVKVLFISPEFFQYINAIIDELNKKDIEVTYFKWWPSLGVFKKYFFKKNEKKRKKIMDKYLDEILEKTKGQNFSMILLCSTIYFTREQTQRLLNAFPKAKKIFFMWDTIINYPITETYLDLFDKFYSFDKTDCEKCNLLYRADFADPSLLAQEPIKMTKDIDLMFLGSVDGYRYKVIKEVEEHCKKEGLNYRFYMYFKSTLIFRLAKLLYKEMRHAKKSEFIFTPIRGKEKDELFARSKAMLEIPRENQNGVPMRTIEALLLNLKVVTNQEAIKLYNLYNENNVAIFSCGEYSSINKNFLDKEFKPLSKEVKKEYTVETFVKELVIDNL